MQTVLITGASGFIGSHLVPALSGAGWQVLAGVRDEAAFEKLKRTLPAEGMADKVRAAYLGSLDRNTSWEKVCQGCDVVIHLAARVHRPEDKDQQAEAEYFEMNEGVTAHLAAKAVKAGVKHFIFMSSVLVVADQSDEPLTETTLCHPGTAYGRSKLAGEKALIAMADRTGMTWTILRPSLVYGKGHKANIARLTRWIRKGIPLPLKGIKNHRSFLFVGNLCDAILTILNSPQSARKIYLVSDGVDFSTSEFVRLIGRCLRRPARLFYMPKIFLRSLGIGRLLGSLAVDPRLIKMDLFWEPPYSPEEGLKITVQANDGACPETGDTFKRVFDVLVSFFALAFLFPFLILIGILIVLTSPGPMLHWSARVGRENKIFRMAKFRTMRLNTPDVATHLLEEPDRYVTPVGLFLRKFSLDELPQLLNVLKGDMSLVGPRPALHNQTDLINLRTEKGIHHLLPGLTGFAQISGRDMISIPQKVRFDEYYLSHKSFWLDISIIIKTFWNVLSKKDVSH